MYKYSNAEKNLVINTVTGEHIPDDHRLMSEVRAWVALDNTVENWKTPAEIDSEARSEALNSIDMAAGAARLRLAAPGEFLDQEYQLAARQVLAWRAARSPADKVPGSVQSWADAAGITAEKSAKSIEDTAVAWEKALLDIRALRLAGKAAVREGKAGSDFASIAKPFLIKFAAVGA